MSLLHAIRHDIKPVASSSVPRELDLTSPAEHVLDTQVSVDNLAPRVGQPVFERALLSRTTKSRRVVITTLLILANVVQMTVNFAGIAGGSALSESLGVNETYASWIAASYALTQGTFVLVSGRLGDVYGHRELVLVGGAWLTICTLANAFCNNFFAFVTMRALAGLGGALIMPNAVAMISSTNPPGRVRNLSLGLFGASAPVGGYFGALFLGAFLQRTEWKWFFVFIACLGVITFTPLWALSPREPPVDRHGKIDCIGSALGTSSLILFSFVWNQAPSVGWSTPYEIVLLISSIILFGGFLRWEKKYAAEPIMPLDIFKAPSFLMLLFVVLLNYMAVGTLIWYQVLWLQKVWHWSPLQFAVGWTPFVICATGAACLAAWMIPRMAAQWILAIGTVTILISNVLMATVPIHQSYWPQIFPSVILFSFCPDFVYTAGQIIASNSVRRNQQGIAGSVIGTLNLYGNSLGLGFASTIEVQIARRSGSQIMGYRAALFFGVAISAVALILDVCFVRLVKDDREGWHEDDHMEEIELTEQAEATGIHLSNVSH
ncbi:Major facilitator superfamily domain general substrate transporter [Penicillium concentricum]|uniref:Major facilitator superfamily domain general substrate transporter n=1 Tax=Penicillium concentricum TaxID=293559 RepID=A0A9W9S465_9EURO|nr:Major facilitator superfamily domain general substrate transporter [Penicillium concentricum]KAJ5371570.1 Major facilitator superfamily domain general substrate transporter [Penicillium concentricum]